MPRRRIQAHNEQLSEFERGRIIGLKDGGWNHADWERIVFSNESSFHLCPDDHRKRVWRRPGPRADPAFTITRHTGPQQGVMFWSAISFEAGPLWASLEAYLQPIDTSTAFWELFLLEYPDPIF
ncbi:transposable element Tc1 transposase [Trichonephila clavipes]|nr:transposable element Tc1 transposase [Trichonephila clavipes]